MVAPDQGTLAEPLLGAKRAAAANMQASCCSVVAQARPFVAARAQARRAVTVMAVQKPQATQ